MAGRRPGISITYRERDDSYRVRWREHGKVKERTFHDEDEAHDAAEAVRQRIRTGLPGSRTHRPIAALVWAWYDGYVQTLEAASVESYRLDVRRVVESIGERDANTATTSDMRLWHKEMAKQLGSARAANKALTALSSAYQRGIEHDPPLVESNPCRGVKRHPEPRRAVIIPNRLQVDYLEATTPADREAAMLLLATRTGPRQGELLALTWRNVLDGAVFYDQVADRKRVVRRHTKTRSSRRVPCPPRAMAALLAIRPPSPSGLVFPSKSDHTRPIDRGGWSKLWAKWRRAAAWKAAEAGEGEDVWGGLLSLEWKNLRHHYASRLAAAGASLLQCSRWMGHASIKTTDENYWFLYDEDEAAVMAAIDG